MTGVADMTCPFCDEPDFDRIGLKTHLKRGYCRAFEATPKRACERRDCPFFAQGRSRGCACYFDASDRPAMS